MAFRIPHELLERTFGQLRACGCGRNECQALWVGPVAHPELISRLVHPAHSASPVGFQLDEAWLTSFWLDMAREGLSVRVQVHTHPGAAYHSATDDAFPMVHSPGFLSLVIPNFGLGPVGFERAFLAQIGDDGEWRQVAIDNHLEIS
jgi:proteasome lid subunit RPN8/RPN11